MKEEFLEACKLIKRDGIESLIAWLEKSDFFYCPASSKFHGAYPGGLVKHSLNVYKQLNRLRTAYPEIEMSDETAAIISLFHDLCKVNLYTVEKRNRKNASGAWETYDAYTFDEKLCYGGHGSKSVFILQNYIKLTAEEAVAINCHMSCWGDDNANSISKAYEQFPVAWLLHVADEAASYIDEKEGK